MDRERKMGHEEDEVKMEMELDAAHALANLAGSDPISNQSSVSQEEDPHQLQAKSEETSNNRAKGNRCRSHTPEKMGIANSTNQPEVSSLRGQKSLNEAERDAKRLRRILANRESARQTILRRQAFRDELARKVSVLSAENLVLKKEKENATREYFHQKEMNQQLKEQMMQMTPLKEEKTFQLPVSIPESEIPVTLRVPACAVSNEAPTIIRKTVADVSCSLTLGIGTTKEETAKKTHEAMIFGKNVNQLQPEYEWKEDCTPYLPLDAAKARRRRMEIARIKQLSRNWN